MKKIIFFFFSIAFSSSLLAQKNVDKKLNTYLEIIEGKITLTSTEKTKILELKKDHLISLTQVIKNYKGKPGFGEKRKKINRKFNAALVEAFGKERVKEINTASKKKKKKNKK